MLKRSNRKERRLEKKQLEERLTICRNVRDELFKVWDERITLLDNLDSQEDKDKIINEDIFLSTIVNRYINECISLSDRIEELD